MKKFFVVGTCILVLTACSSVPSVDIPTLPNAEDIQEQVAKDLAAQGIAMPDLNDTEKPMDVKPALDLDSDSEDIAVADGTAKELWPKVEAYAKAKFPSAVLIGYNNFGATFTNDYILPGREFENGKGERWYYLFVNDGTAFSDEKLDVKGEVFAVEFLRGKLNLKKVEITQNDVSPTELSGPDLLAVDSSVLAENAKKAVKEEFLDEKFVHIAFDCRPTWPATFASGNGDCTLILYVDKDNGYEVEIFNKTGEVQNVKAIDIVDLF